MIDPLRLDFEVGCSAAHAFDVWTRQIARWWPADHSVSGENGLLVVLEGRRGGRVYERTAAGIEHDWGEVTVWEPPRRIVYLWHLRRDRADATEVEISFEEIGDGRTRVQIEHRGWQRLGANAAEWRERNLSGWTTLLPHYVAAVQLFPRIKA